MGVFEIWLYSCEQANRDKVCMSCDFKNVGKKGNTTKCISMLSPLMCPCLLRQQVLLISLAETSGKGLIYRVGSLSIWKRSNSFFFVWPKAATHPLNNKLAVTCWSFNLFKISNLLHPHCTQVKLCQKPLPCGFLGHLTTLKVRTLMHLSDFNGNHFLFCRWWLVIRWYFRLQLYTLPSNVFTIPMQWCVIFSW